MPWAAAAVVAAAGITYYSQQEAADKAAESQEKATQAAIDEQRRQQAEMEQALGPYQLTGDKSIMAQRQLLGLEGADAQQEAYRQIEESPQFMSLVQQGESAILQNAAATGGLRGGNTQAALAQFRPQMLQQTISDQLRNLGGLSTLGQAAAANQAAQGAQFGSNISGLLSNIGQAQAGQALAQGQATSDFASSLAQAAGYSQGGF